MSEDKITKIEPRFPAQVGEQLAGQLQPVMKTMLKETLKASKKDNLDTYKVHLTVTAEEGLELMEWLKARKARRDALEDEL
jgi:hypothetical protein